MLSWMRHPSGRPVLPRLALIVTAAAFIACEDDPTDPDTLNLAAEFDGTGTFEDVTGTAAIVASASAFEATVEIAGAPADAVFLWTVREGTCAEPGNLVGAAASYPDLEVDDDGEAVADADIAATLDADDDYVIVVTDDSGEAPVTVACGTLERV